jgi:3-phosphoglycerate kinase
MKSIDDIEVTGLRVLVRSDLNVPSTSPAAARSPTTGASAPRCR